jgi:DNA helicase II / ATP-dependent DNA helicase PcrA
MQLTEKQRDILAARGHLLVTGGPGSGKTTIAILKAAQIAASGLRPNQQILFLSFARATVSRVVEAIEHEQKLPRDERRHIEVETYHSFFWRILKAHGYLVGLPRRLLLLSPHNEAIALSAIRSAYPAESKLSDAQKIEKQAREQQERLRLAREEGRACFDLFAQYAGDILRGSERLRQLVCGRYPVIILDEFQDTNADQWHVVRELGKHSTLLALADPEQRIYDWIGADPERLNHFRAAFAPTEIDLSTDNHRSPGTDIALFGNEILKRRFSQESYAGIKRLLFPPNANEALTQLVTTTYAARTRIIKNKPQDWSLAILVPTRRMTRFVSDTFRSPPAGMTEIPHTAAVEMEAAILAAETIALLMQPDRQGDHFEQLIGALCNYFHGKGGDTPAKGDLQEAANIQKAYAEGLARQADGKAVRRNSLLIAMRESYAAARAVALTGDPDADWRAIRGVINDGPCARLKGLAAEARNVRLLERGTQLRQALAQDWRDNGAYVNALAITQQAFAREHFATNVKPETGVIVMNMHKAKGKQFDEVIIFEGWPRAVRGKIVANPDRIVYGNAQENDNDQARQNFRVSVTRGKRRITILTPRGDPCILLLNQA